MAVARHLHRRRVAHPRQVRAEGVAIGGHLLGAAPPLGGALSDALPIKLDELDAERRRLAPPMAEACSAARATAEPPSATRARRASRVASSAAANAAPSSACFHRAAASLRRPPRRLGLHHLGAFVNPHLGGREIRLCAPELSGELRLLMYRARRRLRLGARDVGGAPPLRRLRRLRALLRLRQHCRSRCSSVALSLGGRARASRRRRPPLAAPRCAWWPTLPRVALELQLRAQPRELPLSAAAVITRRCRGQRHRGGRVADEYCGDSTGVPSSGSPTLGGVAAGEATGRGAAFLVEEVVVALADRDPRRAGGVTVRVRARADKLPWRLASTARRAARADSSSAGASSSMLELCS